MPARDVDGYDERFDGTIATARVLDLAAEFHARCWHGFGGELSNFG